ncbi:uncharacterized protein LOC113330491 [Papaver somniferum]|uniref:uncharacterized protein LOC113330491 n=1 Tax=Papaver somniferum TaxID=3469 RepID=UPI000E6F7B56|nr:uncharacterized protein LOC113330491 [Papaver somniferum]
MEYSNYVCPNTGFLLVVVLLASVAVYETVGDAMVTGTVFCDQCKDGERGLFDYPLSGMKVAVTCSGIDGQVTMMKEETTNMVGSYSMSFEGNPKLSGCYAQLVGSTDASSGCGAAAGPARSLRLMFSMFNMEISYCQNTTPNPLPGSGSDAGRPALPLPHAPSPPPTARLPSMPFLQASACPYGEWTKAEHKCHWNVVGPDTKVAVAFGLIAAGRYGTDMTLWKGLQGKGDVYRTLLREGTTALLNSYNSLQFRYPTISVVERLNSALMGSTRQALQIALRFKRANSGLAYNNNTAVRCNLTPCKN